LLLIPDRKDNLCDHCRKHACRSDSFWLIDARSFKILTNSSMTDVSAWDAKGLGRTLNMKRCIDARGLLAATALAVLATGFAAPAWARTNYAVLMAVTAYPNLPPKNALIGPNHDAKLVREYLTTRAPIKFDAANVTILADGLDGANASPTRAQILSTLAEVADKAQPGDFVYLHYSGHGSQQPTLTPETETDGLDEILLPADSAPWDKEAKRIPNALVDDEIGEALDAVRDKGAFVWIVVDACNSGSVTRAAAVGTADQSFDRKLDPTDPNGLAIPASDMPAAGSDTAAGGERTSDMQLIEDAGERAIQTDDQTQTGAKPIEKGGMVAFFAAQTIETTPEMPLPRGVDGAERFGLFTFTIFSKLAENPSMTYRQLGHSVLQQYAAEPRQRPTPIFEGELDAPVFGSEPIETDQQWQIEARDNGLTLPAGLLHRLTPGTRLAILPKPASDLSETLGYVEVKKAENLTSQVVPVAFDGKPALKPADLPPNAYARLSEVAVTFKLKVARPSVAADLDDEVKLVDAMLDKVASAEDKRFNVELVPAGAAADLRLVVLRESDVEGAGPDASSEPALWFLPSSGELSLTPGQRPPRIVIHPDDPDKLATSASENLENMSAGRLDPLQESTVPTVNPGDQLNIVAQNDSGSLIDINVLYIGSDYSITRLDAQRLVNGARLETPVAEFTADSFGTERMIAVVTEAPPLSEVEDLSFLEQGKVPSLTRSGAEQSSFAAALANIGSAATRAAIAPRDKGGTKNAVLIFPIEIVPTP